ncbi:HK97 family phage prohead protease [Bartonella tamiae]|uniref:HK97 family phage prohead protease n=1 Tax=Bartonella tamiae Th239 TaxID=1094558 RepID=J1K3G8_9HYPH|nr:HK97 family phage prohead protease [Bartonella tamiae]EJF91675.1 HK97 family phage prohead protease [Bartonella tamiae Th239]
MKTKEINFQVKNLSENGTFQGYGSIFDNIDSYGEVVKNGAFSQSLKKHQEKGTNVVMLWQHNREEPIGVWSELQEDQKGLIGKGHINLDVQKGREAYSLMKQGALTGLSIGYQELKAHNDNNVRLLTELDLYEISPVTFAANSEARIESLKSKRFEDFAQNLRDGKPMPIKDFEDILREAGIPKSMATQIASVGYAKAIRSESDSNKANEATAFLNALCVD